MIAAHTHRDRVVLSILLSCVTYMLFTLNDSAQKMLASKFHYSQIMFTSGVFVIVLFVVYGALREGRKAFQTKKLKWMFLRGLSAQVVAMCNLHAFPHLPLTTFYTLVFTCPLWISLMSALLLKDQLDRRRLGVILAGFLIILYIFRPGGGLFSVWALVVLAGCVFYSLQLILMRKIGVEESRSFMFILGSVITLVITGPMLPVHYIEPTLYEWGLFLNMAIMGGIGLMCISYAIQITPAPAIVAPYHYTQIFWGAIMGYFLFKEVPSVPVMAGACLIILAGLWLIFDEAKRAKKPVSPLQEF